MPDSLVEPAATISSTTAAPTSPSAPSQPTSLASDTAPKRASGLDHLGLSELALAHAKSVRAHKGHRILMIRGFSGLCQTTISLSLVGIKDQFYLVGALQFFGSMTLFFQWRTGNPLMFVLRGGVSWCLCLIAIYTATCGKIWLWEEECNRKAWHDAREPLRMLHCVGAVRRFFNGLSLFCQFKNPQRMFQGHGNEQLFFRGCIQASGVVIHSLLYTMKRLELDGTQWERETHEELSHFLRMIFIVVSSWSLFHQWWFTGKGATGHPLSNAYEHLRRHGSSVGNSLGGMHDQADHIRAKAAEKARQFNASMLNAGQYCADATLHAADVALHHATDIALHATGLSPSHDQRKHNGEERTHVDDMGSGDHQEPRADASNSKVELEETVSDGMQVAVNNEDLTEV